MTFVVDFASSYKNISGAQLVAIGAGGWIAYTGCNNTAKNISKSKFQEYMDTGIPGALVIENGTQDVLGGEKAGASLAQHVMAGAEALGYDVAHCALATSADFNETTAAQYAETIDCMGAFGALVPVPVYYGDGDSIDRVIPATRCVYGWQSDSTSFSPGGTSHLARLQQIYNDPRAKGLVVDVNNVLGAPLYFMGEHMTDVNVVSISKDAITEIFGAACLVLPAEPGGELDPNWTGTPPIWELIAQIPAQFAEVKRAIAAAAANGAAPAFDYAALAAALLANPTFAQVVASAVQSGLAGMEVLSTVNSNFLKTPAALALEGNL